MIKQVVLLTNDKVISAKVSPEHEVIMSELKSTTNEESFRDIVDKHSIELETLDDLYSPYGREESPYVNISSRVHKENFLSSAVFINASDKTVNFEAYVDSKRKEYPGGKRPKFMTSDGPGPLSKMTSFDFGHTIETFDQAFVEINNY